MRVIVDANIVFSGILNSKGKIGDLLINSRKHLEFIAPDFLREEIFQTLSTTLQNFQLDFRAGAGIRISSL